MSKKYLLNHQIRAKEVRLINADGSQAGIVPIEQALKQAIDDGMDLVLVTPRDVVPAVCKIVDYGQLKYKEAKKEKKAKKLAKVTSVLKELKISHKISEHDYMVRVNAAKKFLEKGYKVKISLMFKGREVTHAVLGLEKMRRLALDLADSGVLESEPRMIGRHMHMIIAAGKHH